MFSLLSNDTILCIILQLKNIQDLMNLSSIDKNMFEIFGNNLYIDWGRNLYSAEFWNRASQRTSCISKPLCNMKMELLRIDNFQKHIVKHRHEMWTSEDFYSYWSSLEKIWKNTSRPRYPTNEEIYRALDIL